MTTANPMTLPETRISEFVADMARKHRVAYTRTYADAWLEADLTTLLLPLGVLAIEFYNVGSFVLTE
jgi:hypothetical protein